MYETEKGNDTMTSDERVIIDYLKGSIDNLASKFDKFLEKQENINNKVEENTRDISDIKEAKLISKVEQHDSDIRRLMESREAKWATRHPVLAGGLNYVLLIIIFCIVAHFLPGVAKLVGSI